MNCMFSVLEVVNYVWCWNVYLFYILMTAYKQQQQQKNSHKKTELFYEQTAFGFLLKSRPFLQFVYIYFFVFFNCLNFVKCFDVKHSRTDPLTRGQLCNTKPWHLKSIFWEENRLPLQTVPKCYRENYRKLFRDGYFFYILVA